MTKFGRNDKCWCGSGKKYKKCHLGRDKQEPLGRGEAQNALKLFTSSSKCSVPENQQHECANRIVKAHTLSRANSLKEIAFEGHVLGLKHGIGNLERNNGQPTLERVGINQASTFTGFCSFHDKELFSCIEDEPFQLTSKQCTMIAYRPLMREFYVKEAALKFAQQSRMFDKGWGFREQFVWAKMCRENIEGTELSLKDLKFIKNCVEDSIHNGDYDALRHFIIRLNQPPKVMACGIHGPVCDIFGDNLQDITSNHLVRPAYLIANLLALDGNGYFIFSWLPEDDAVINRFIDAIQECDASEVGDRLVTYIFTFFENLFTSEEWWGNLGEEKEYLLKLMMQGLNMHLYDLSLIEKDKNKYDALKVKDYITL
ncbi:YecA family protein [Enterobacter bugandensis]|uniref:YecA family protein n=1 Tax=Enterobacter bugandensis TaxID=881260 RepID=UPI0021D2AB9F|nr:SEC-C domain-containing protein [Enterobacter bugandensis]MCU6214419.1 SEC-C domain-containing protein [Enterobacter bugandensis]